MLSYFKAYFLKHLNSYKDFITGKWYLSNQEIHAFKIHYLKQRFSDKERTSVKNYIRNKEDQLYQAVMEIIVKANENRLKEGKRDMCNALLELMKDELNEKREEGEALGESRINQLNLKLSELNRSDEILKAAVDREYQKKLLNEFGL